MDVKVSVINILSSCVTVLSSVTVRVTEGMVTTLATVVVLVA